MSLEKVYLASPSVQFFMAKTARETIVRGILRLLKSRFGSAPESLAAQLRTINDQEKLDDLLIVAAECDDLKAFRAAVSEE